MKRLKVYKELIDHGATPEKAAMYCRFVDEFVELSRKDDITDRHHILSKESGWWKKYEHREWNIAVISWQLHNSLHAILCYLFPTNEGLFKAAKLTSNLFRGNDKKLRIKPQIIRLYKDGMSAPQIADRYDICHTTVRKWLRQWNIPIRSRNEASSLRQSGNKKITYKMDIIRWYKKGDSLSCIGKRIGINGVTITKWLQSWGIPKREGIGRAFRMTESKKLKIVHLYEKGMSPKRIGKIFGVTEGTIIFRLQKWGVRIRSYSESQSMSRFGNKKERWKEEIVLLYKRGKTCRYIGNKFSIHSMTVWNWLRGWKVPMRPKGPAPKSSHGKVSK